MDSSEKVVECERSLRYPNEGKTVHITYLREDGISNGVVHNDADEHSSVQDMIQVNTVLNDLVLEVEETAAECNYKCEECKKSFTDFNIFEDHLKQHNPHKCEVCGICFPTESLLDYHIRTHKNDSTLFLCKICKKMCNYFDLKIHEKTHIAKTQYPCEKCKKCFCTKRGLRAHKSKHKQFNIDDNLKTRALYKCELCQICFTSESLLKCHRKICIPNFYVLQSDIGGKHLENDFTLKSQEGKDYQCAECKRVFVNEKDLHTHKLTHEEMHKTQVVNSNEASSHSFDSSLALYKFDSQNGALSNTSACSNKFTCQVCSKSFTKKFSLIKHSLIHVGDSFKCRNCGEEFSENSQLIEHNKTHIQKPYKCTVCDKMYNTLSRMRNHYRSHIVDKPFMCSKCKESFVDEDSLNMHLNNHNSGEFFHCTTCSKCFGSVSSFQGHCRTHTGEKPYSCPSCDRAFADTSTLNRHVRVMHADKKPEFPCSLCSKVYARKTTLKHHIASCHENIHIERHQDIKLDKLIFKNNNLNLLENNDKNNNGKIKAYSCMECEKSYSYEEGLYLHSIIHTGERTHVCSKCGKRFLNLTALKRHYNTHTGEKLHLCSQCGKKFLELSNFKKHLRIHTGEKPFKCSECDKCFTDSTTCKRHCTSHTGEKPYVCHICGDSFATLPRLTRHIKYHVGEKCHKCNFCDKSFVERGTLTKHYKTHFRTRTESVIYVQDLLVNSKKLKS